MVRCLSDDNDVDEVVEEFEEADFPPVDDLACALGGCQKWRLNAAVDTRERDGSPCELDVFIPSAFSDFAD